MSESQIWSVLGAHPPLRNVIDPSLEINCELGEAPFYEEKSHTLRFVDIIKKKLHAVNLDKGPSSLKTLELEDAVGFTTDIDDSEGGKILVGAKYGYATLDRLTGRLEYVKKIWSEEDGPEKGKRMRFDDGAVDSQGRVWGGAMNDPMSTDVTDEAVLFRLDPNMSLHRILEKLTIPNGLGWSSDDKSMFFTDSPTKSIFKFDYDAETGKISNRKEFFRLVGEAPGAAPDGLAIDVDGCVWTAIYGGGKVLRISPDGQVIGQVSLPTRCVTCPAFVGELLFVTSAEEEDPDAYPDSAKFAGSLFRVHVGVQGQKLRRCQERSK
ncbi:MAG: hypothetical protein MMC33_001513 [Icmadophila ericetorum]|nr:hypothetical protein [Icmadophila ericetorum]